MPSAIRKINVIGHQHPDTDSICAAISYAYLKNQKGDGIVYQARRAGNLNRETAFVLKHFGFEEPRLITSVTPQLKDADIQYTVGIGKETSLYAAWTLMRELKMDTLYITHVHTTIPEADAFFPVIEEEYWEKVSVSETHFDEATGHEFEFVVYKKRQA